MNRWPAIAVFLGIVFPITAVAPGQFESSRKIQPNDVVTVLCEDEQAVDNSGLGQKLPGKKRSTSTIETRVTEVLPDGRLKLYCERISFRVVQTKKRTLRNLFKGQIETHKVPCKMTLSGVVPADKVTEGNIVSSNDIFDLNFTKTDLPTKR